MRLRLAYEFEDQIVPTLMVFPLIKVNISFEKILIVCLAASGLHCGMWGHFLLLFG